MVGTGTPIVNYMDVFERPGLRPDDLSGRVNLSPDKIRNFEVRQGDVFFTRTSETVEEVGVASVMLDEPCDTVFSGFVLRARPRDGRLMDAEIAALERRRDKTRLIKQGMMQQLLTGRVRLGEPE